MNTDFSTVCERAERSGAAVLDNLAQIEAALRDVQGELANLPFFVRAFATAEVTRGTGQDIPAWTAAVSGLIAAVQEAMVAVARARGAGAVGEADRTTVLHVGERVDGERRRLDSLVSFMQKVPAKVSAVPAGLFPADRRDEFLGAIEGQVQAMRAALAAMPDLAESLRTLGSEAA